jgi:hypothetical protein
MKRYLTFILPFFLVGVICALFFFTGDLCLFRRILGIPCPGCGMTRAYLSLLRLDITSAFFYHPLFLCVPSVCAVILLRNRNFFQKLYQSPIFWTILVILFLGVYIVRMLTLFPNTPPMDYNANSVLFRLFSALKIN